MSTIRIIVFGEGRHELGDRLRQPITENDLSALPRLVHRLSGGPCDIEYLCVPLKEANRIHGKAVNNFSRKAKGAIFRARQENCRAAVILIDRDTKPNRERIGALREGRDEMTAGPYPPCAVGTAVEAFDAWMMAAAPEREDPCAVFRDRPAE